MRSVHALWIYIYTGASIWRRASAGLVLEEEEEEEEEKKTRTSGRRGWATKDRVFTQPTVYSSRAASTRGIV